MRRFKKPLIAIFLMAIFFGCEPRNKQEAVMSVDQMITGVSYFDVEAGSFIDQAYVYIDSGRIYKISSEMIAGIAVADTIQGNGKFLIPGLTEMHAHIPTDESRGREYVEETLFLYLSQGITTIRGMLGAPFHLQLKDMIRDGEILSPRVYTSGPSLNGNTVQSVEEARNKVIAQHAAGYDFLKLHPGLTLDNFNTIDKVADSLDIPYAGHVSVFVGVERALEAGYASIDHLDGYVEALVADDVDPESNGFFGFNFTYLADTSKVDELVRLTLENEVAVVPTQCLLERWAGPVSADSLASQPEMRYISRQTLENWRATVANFQSNEEFSQEKAGDFIALRRMILNRLYTSDALILMGSDAPQVFNVPGFSLHREIRSMADFGMSAEDILRSGTSEVAAYFGDGDEFGSIREGLSADLVLLNANPLEDVANLQDIAGVMVRGSWLDREAIDERLSEIAASYE